MTREEFIDILERKGYSYELEGDKIVVTGKGDVYLQSLETLPSGVVFNNGGYVYLESLKTLPPGVVFKNRGDVYLNSLISLRSKPLFWKALTSSCLIRRSAIFAISCQFLSKLLNRVVH